MAISAHRGVGLPSFCHWRAVLGVALVSVSAALLILLGRPGWPGLAGAIQLILYCLGLGLTCTTVLCVLRAWLRRMSTRDAWLAAWLVVLVTSIAFSFSVAVVAGTLGAGFTPENIAPFLLRSALAVAIVSGGMFRYLHVRGQWEAQTLAQAEARVQALQSRIRPHFLFNSLNTIASLVPDDPDNAERATLDLADLFRGSMQRVDRLIPLADELDLARKYLAMEHRRLGERLEIHWDIDELPGDAQVLPMTLQPLLENAVGHGIQPRPEGGDVRLYGCRQGGSVVITISNPLAETAPKPGQGHALRNVIDRLELTFGTEASLVTNQDDARFYAVLTLPHVASADR